MTSSSPLSAGGLLPLEQVTSFFKVLQAQNPTPQTELLFTNPYTLLVAVLLSAQATDKGVNKATEKLFQKISTPQEMLDLGLEELYGHIKIIGLYPTKGRNIIALSQILVDHYEGKIPTTRTALESLPGVGRKTANVVLNVAFGHPTLPVDTHIFRVSRRVGLAQGKTPLQVEEQLLERIPSEFLTYAHHWLILHGRYICKAQKPLCHQCPVKEVCLSSPF